MSHRLLRAVGLVAALAAAAVGLVLPAAPARPAIQIHRVDHTEFSGLPTDKVFVLIVGNDFRPGVGGKRADALHLVGVNPAEGRGTILNIPRDTWVDIPGRGGGKINSANTFGGPELQAAAVERLTGIRPQFVVMTDFAGMTGMVDELGGLTIDIPMGMADAASGAFFSPGPQHLNGAQVLAFSRNRHLSGGDFTRSENQARVILAALAQLRRQDTSPVAVARHLEVLARHVELWGVDLPDLYRLGRLALGIDPAQMASVTMPGRVGSARGQSVVLATAAAGAVFADMADDAVVGGG